MPFYYFGAKKMLAKHYPAPRFSTIIEPFAGSAAYAIHYWHPGTRVILIEKDERLAEFWLRLRSLSISDLLAIECPPIGTRSSDPIINLIQVSGHVMKSGFYDAKVTVRMARDWPRVQRSLAKALPKVRDWEIICGDYTLAPDMEATWFIDPPYQGQGSVYKYGPDQIDYSHLGKWCRERQGQVIAVEQDGADWLPFRKLCWHESVWPGTMRMETVWSNDDSI